MLGLNKIDLDEIMEKMRIPYKLRREFLDILLYSLEYKFGFDIVEQKINWCSDLTVDLIIDFFHRYSFVTIYIDNWHPEFLIAYSYNSYTNCHWFNWNEIPAAIEFLEDIPMEE